jgi:hypothetical protein
MSCGLYLVFVAVYTMWSVFTSWPPGLYLVFVGDFIVAVSVYTMYVFLVAAAFASKLARP